VETLSQAEQEKFLTHFFEMLDSHETIASYLTPLDAGRLITEHPNWTSCMPAKDILEEKLTKLTHTCSLLLAVLQQPSLQERLSGTGEGPLLTASDRLCIVKSL